MGYAIAIWEQIRSTVRWKTSTLVENIKKEVALDYSLREFHGLYPVPWQLKDVLSQRGDNWVQRLYDPCCDAYKADGSKELSLEFDLAVWAYWIEPFIMREVQTTEEGYRASELLELLLCAAGSTPEKRRALKVGQKDCCVAVRNELYQAWYDKLHHRPSRIEEAARTTVAYDTRQRRATGIVTGVPAEPTQTSTIASPAPAAPLPAVLTSSSVTKPSGESLVTKPLEALEQPALLTPSALPKNSSAKKWQSIEIRFLSEHRVQIRVDGKDMEVLNYAEFGFEDGRSEKPNRAWELFCALAQHRGIIPNGKVVGEDWAKIEKRIQEIRKVLREYFGLTDDPIPFVQGTGYQSLFKISCTQSFHR